MVSCLIIMMILLYFHLVFVVVLQTGETSSRTKSHNNVNLLLRSSGALFLFVLLCKVCKVLAVLVLCFPLVHLTTLLACKIVPSDVFLLDEGDFHSGLGAG